MRRSTTQTLALRYLPAGAGAFVCMSWLSDEDEEVEPLDDDDFMPSDQSSDLFDDMPDEAQSDSWSEEELDDSYDPTDLEDFG